jgi:hypothetical protein
MLYSIERRPEADPAPIRNLADAPLLLRMDRLSGVGLRGAEERSNAAAFLENVSEKKIEVLDFRNGYFPFKEPRSRTASRRSNAISIRRSS